jgi:hypothetical protein
MLRQKQLLKKLSNERDNIARTMGTYYYYQSSKNIMTPISKNMFTTQREVRQVRVYACFFTSSGHDPLWMDSRNPPCRPKHDLLDIESNKELIYKQNDHCFKTHYKYALVIFVNWTSSYKFMLRCGWMS